VSSSRSGRTRSAKSFVSSRLITRLACTALLGAVAAPVVVPVSSAAAANKLGSRTLREGDKGTDVKELQQLLSAVGIKVRADGAFGAGTTTAVKRFQRIARLQASGKVGPKTISALRQSASGGDAAAYDAGGYGTQAHSTRSLGDRLPLRPGMSGHDVKILQDFLSRAGFRTTVDGQFADGTVTALKKFETANKLPVDELVDAQDVEVLRGQAGAGENAPDAAAPLQLGPGDKATVGSDGFAIAPASAPDAVKQMIAAGNAIAKKPYIYGGGHGNFPEDKGYDCSGSVSYALWGAKLLKAPLVSGDFPNWGDSGPGHWVSIYGNSGHVFMVVAGLRFDTSGAKQDGTRWHATSRPTQGYVVRHPSGL
jgi:peptidoglycan hydrolase-like protein with peptidoglycan-binding domain